VKSLKRHGVLSHVIVFSGVFVFDIYMKPPRHPQDMSWSEDVEKQTTDLHLVFQPQISSDRCRVVCLHAKMTLKGLGGDPSLY